MELQGRVGSVNLIGVFGGLVVGAGIGGLLAQHFGLTAPFWFAFVGSAIFVVRDLGPAAAHRPRRAGAGGGFPGDPVNHHCSAAHAQRRSRVAPASR